MKSVSDGLSGPILRDVYNSGFGALRTRPANSSQFGEALTVSRTPILELNSSYGFSALRDLSVLSGSGSITQSASTINVNTGTTADSTARLSSAEIGRYIPGYGAEIGVGMLMPELPVGEQQAIWGGIGQNDDNGLYFGIDATGYFVATERGGVVTKTYQQDWNLDRLDGLGRSGFQIDVTAGQIFQIQFTWYGFGQLLFGIIGIVQTQSGFFVQDFIPCHSIKMDGQTSLQTPNLRVFAEVSNGATASNLTARVGGRQYSVVGNYIPKYRFTSDWRAATATDTTVIPLVAFRRKVNFGDRSIKLQGFDAVATGTNHIIEARVNATITGGTWGTPSNHTAAETALESNRTATAVSGGIVIWQSLVSASLGNQAGNLAGEALDFDVPNGQSIALCARTTTGTGTLASAFRMREEW